MNNSTGKNQLSRYVCICCIAILGFTSFVYYPRWNKPGVEATISWDVSGYYWYLPSIFIYKDLKHQGFKDSILRKYNPTNDFQQAFQVDGGNYVLKYSSGMAVMYLPFFATGHVAAGLLGYPQDGFSRPYQLAIQLGAFLVAIIGIWYLRKLLLRYYTDSVVAIVIAILVIGTNYLNYSVIDGGMSHNWLFTLYVFLLLNTARFYETFSAKYALRIGLLAGLATLTRPTDALSALIPLLWGMESILPRALGQRLRLFFSHFRSFVLAAACAAVVVSVQFIYWKYASGHWIIYSYQDQHLWFRSPSIMNYTFSYRSGWLRYTPMLMLSFAGLIPFWVQGRNKVAITAFFLINYYFVCSWSIWWFGGRAMMQSYPVLMFPMASLVDAAINSRWLKIVLVPVVGVCAYLNIWFVHQSHRGGLYDTETMNKAYYNRVIGRWSVPAQTIMLRDNAELYEGEPANVKVIYQNDLETDTSLHETLPAIAGQRSLELNEHTKDIIEYKFRYGGGDAQWLRFRADVRCVIHEGDLWKMAQLVGRVYKNGKKQKENMMRIYRLLGDNQTRTMTLDMNIEGLHPDSVSIGFWNGYSEKPLVIDNIKVYSFNAGR